MPFPIAYARNRQTLGMIVLKDYVQDENLENLKWKRSDDGNCRSTKVIAKKHKRKGVIKI